MKNIEKYRSIGVKLRDLNSLELLSQKFTFKNNIKLSRETKKVILDKDYMISEVINRYVPINPNIKERKFEWEYHWNNLPKFNIDNPDKEILVTIEFIIISDYSDKQLSNLFEQNVSKKTPSLSFPYIPIGIDSNKRVTRNPSLKPKKPRYPIYIISKGRAKHCTTADYLIKMDIDFKIVIEESEFKDYLEIYPKENLLELNRSFIDNYDTYIENFDISKSKGSGPARNFVWHHSKNVLKADFHWILDDNIFGFYYFNNQKRLKCSDSSPFTFIEDFVNRYNNIGIAGMNYMKFVIPGNTPPYISNTKIYSCILINNNIPIRWAGRYNEDVDICIRALKLGYSTIQFNIFNADKMTTQKTPGGNTEAFYSKEGTLPKSNMLKHNHPDITNVSWKYSRWHHQVDYNKFKDTRDRTILETIKELNSNPILFLDTKEDNKIIEYIKNTNFKTLTDWSEYLEFVPKEKRNLIIGLLKTHRWIKDSDKIIELITKRSVLKCDVESYLLGLEIDITNLDNRIMLDLLKLGDNRGILTKDIDWNNYLSYVDKEKRDNIVNALKKNKYLLKKDYIIESTEHDFQIIELTKEEHKKHFDSKAYIFNNYINKGTNKPLLDEPVTFFDKKRRKEVVIERSKFTQKIVNKYDKSNFINNGDNTIFICGDEEFDNLKLLNDTCNQIVHMYTKVASLVDYEIDVQIANYCLENNIKNVNFKPNFTLNGKFAIKYIYEKIITYSNYFLIFSTSRILTNNIQFLVDKIKESKKEFKIVYNDKTEMYLNDW
jgi:hypothetical protein